MPKPESFIDGLRHRNPTEYVLGATFGVCSLVGAGALVVAIASDPAELKKGAQKAHDIMDDPAAELRAADQRTITDLEDLRQLKYVAKTGEFRHQANEMEDNYSEVRVDGKVVGRKLPAYPLYIPQYASKTTLAGIMKYGDPLTDQEAAKYAKYDKSTPAAEKKSWVKVKTDRVVDGFPVANQTEFEGYIKLTDKLTEAYKESIGPQTKVVDHDDELRVEAANNLNAAGNKVTNDVYVNVTVIKSILDKGRSLEPRVAEYRKYADHQFKQP